MDALTLLADQVWPEQKLRCPESGRTNLQGGGQASEVGLGPRSLGMGMEEAPCPPLSNQVAMKAKLREDLGCQGLKEQR